MPIVTLAQRPDLAKVLERPELNPGPELMFHDTVAGRYWGRLAEEFGDHQLALVRGEEVIARANSVPLAWRGSPDELPDAGFAWALEQAFADRDAGREPTIACALYIAVSTRHQGAGVSAVMAQALRDTATRHGLTALAAPLRPTLKHRYPLIPMAEYATWTRETDGLALDPWLRTHQRLGARLLHPCERSMRVEGTVAEWRRWAAMDFPGSGRHVVDGALAPVTIDLAADHGVYDEPNLWAWHPLT
ncbi:MULTISPECIES: hypothetical protein [unclassified Nocardiopsis]|uniref:hypothetical protein n=1 Tax=unclassified Nocardiopsis TaxID=2649073 RepID=UPI0034057E3D